MKGLILVTGSTGLVGSRFVEVTERKNFLHLPKEVELDITNEAEIKAVMESYNFSAVINFAAYTDVDAADKQRGNKEDEAWLVNVEGVRNLAEAVKPYKERIHFIQISTDMVFSGSKEDPGPYLENHPPEEDLSKLTWYGYTKAEAERVLKNVLGESATILRINYPVRANFKDKPDYLRKHLKLFDEGKLYPLFTDQQISISFIDEVCRLIDKIIIENKRGNFHVSTPDTTRPYELIGYMLEKVRGEKGVVEETTLTEFMKENDVPSYRYPAFGGLSPDLTEKRLKIRFSSWRQVVDKLISQGLGTN